MTLDAQADGGRPAEFTDAADDDLASPTPARVRDAGVQSPYLKRMEDMILQINRVQQSWEQRTVKLAAELADERRNGERLERVLRERQRQIEVLEGRVATSDTRIASLLQDAESNGKTLAARNDAIAILKDAAENAKQRERDLAESLRRSDDEKEEMVRRFDVVLDALNSDGPQPSQPAVASPSIDISDLGLDAEQFARDVVGDLGIFPVPAGATAPSLHADTHVTKRNAAYA